MNSPLSQPLRGKPPGRRRKLSGVTWLLLIGGISAGALTVIGMAALVVYVMLGMPTPKPESRGDERSVATGSRPATVSSQPTSAPPAPLTAAAEARARDARAAERGFSSGTVLWDPAAREPGELQIPFRRQREIVFGAIGCPLVVVGREVWNLQQGQLVQQLQGQLDGNGLRALSNDGQMAGSGR